MSLEARGTLNDVITYAVLRRTCYSKAYFKPANPKSNAQQGTRAMARYLCQTWKALSTENHAEFQQLAEQWNTSPYHAWLALNSRRWVRHQMPFIHSIQNPTISARSATTHDTINVRQHSIHSTIQEPDFPPLAIEICFDTEPDFQPTRNNAKLILGNPTIIEDYFHFYGTWIAPDNKTYYGKWRWSIYNSDTSDFNSIL